MQSSGGLTDAHLFQGKDAILSGPAGGIVGAVEVSRLAGFDRIIGFDMGGTSTDVTHWAGEYERAFVTEVAGVRLRAPMMRIHTVAAGGGSICTFDGARFRVGPQSAGANPGPASYRRGGPLAVTDCNVMVGKLDPALFPKVFGPDGDAPLDADIVRAKFASLADEIAAATGVRRTPEEIADGFLKIAVENMANAIKHISVARGYDVTEYTLCCFGGAGGQHACAVADALGMTRVFIHPLAGVLSAYGMGLADVRSLRQQAVETPLRDDTLAQLDAGVRAPRVAGPRRGAAAGHRRFAHPRHAHAAPQVRRHRHDARNPLRATISRAFVADVRAPLPAAIRLPHAGQGARRRGGRGRGDGPHAVGDRRAPDVRRRATARLRPLQTNRVYTDGAFRDAPVYAREDLRPGDAIDGPSIIRERNATTVIEPGWRATLDARATTWCSSASKRRSARTRSARPPIRCCSRCSTTCSWRSPSRWASRSPTPRTRSTSRSGSIFPARCSTRKAT